VPIVVKPYLIRNRGSEFERAGIAKIKSSLFLGKLLHRLFLLRLHGVPMDFRSGIPPRPVC